MTFEVLYKQWNGKIATLAKQYCIPGHDLDDIAQELSVVFWRCFNAYDPSSGNQFSTLFYTAARNKLITMLYKATAIKRTSPGYVSMEEAEKVLMAEAYADVEFEWEITSFVRDKQVVSTIKYIIRGGDSKKVPRPVFLKVREYTERYYAERS